MVEPQEDLILKMVSHLENDKSEMSLVNSERKPYLSERATNNALKVENFSLELGEEVKDVQLRVAGIRKKIDENRGSHENFNGFLVG